MRQSRLFRRYYLLTAFIVLVFILFGFWASRLVIQFSGPQGPSPLEGRHFVLYAKLVDLLDRSQGEVTTRRKAALADISEWNLAGPSLRLALVGQDGRVIDPPESVLPFDWSQVQKPERPYVFLPIGDSTRRSDVHGLIRLEGAPPQYLYAFYERPAQAPPPHHFNRVFIWTFVSMIVAVLMGIAFSLVLIFRMLREKARLADEVLAQMQHGNLKARFPIKKMDEIGQAMSRFNRMADEIERLVEQAKEAEKSRMKLLQELAHDLRTPVASQKNLLETLLNKGEAVVPSLRRELLSLTLTETEYFERLVEDLLVLAQVGEPRYRIESERVCLNDLVREEAENISSRLHSTGPEGSRPIELKDETSGPALTVRGDSHLLRRMIRNALSNAFSFARTQVSVRVERDIDGKGVITVDDDGEGFTEETLASFGVRRISRSLGGVDRKGKLSVGLGSVILKTVAESHGGSVRAGNRGSASGVVGARVEVFLPLN